MWKCFCSPWVSTTARKQSRTATTTEKYQHQHTRSLGQSQLDNLICSCPSGTAKSTDLEETESQSNFLNVSECFFSPAYHKDFPTWNIQLSQSTCAPSTSKKFSGGNTKQKTKLNVPVPLPSCPSTMEKSLWNRSAKPDIPFQQGIMFQITWVSN